MSDDDQILEDLGARLKSLETWRAEIERQHAQVQAELRELHEELAEQQVRVELGGTVIAQGYDQRIEDAVRFLSSIQAAGQYRHRLRAWHRVELARLTAGESDRPTRFNAEFTEQPLNWHVAVEDDGAVLTIRLRRE